MTAIAMMGVVIRWAIFAAVLVATGAAAFRFLVLERLRPVGPGEDAVCATVNDRAATLAAFMTGIGIVAAALRLPLQIEALRDETIPLLPQIQALGLHTMWGAVWLYQLLVLIGACIAFILARTNGRRAWIVAGVFSALAAVSPALNGHAIASERLTTLAVLSSGLHVVGAGMWLGAMFSLLAALTIAMGETAAGPLAARMTRGFSPMALTGAAMVVTTGLFASWLHLGTVTALWQSRYGRVLLVKLCAVAFMVVMGAWNWRKAGPRLAETGAIGPMRRAVRLEVLIGEIIIATTAVLVAMPPAGEE